MSKLNIYPNSMLLLLLIVHLASAGTVEESSNLPVPVELKPAEWAIIKQQINTHKKSQSITPADRRFHLASPSSEFDPVIEQNNYIKASNPNSFDVFGWSVSLHGDRLAVGAWGEASDADGVNGDESDNSAFNAGAVYVFNRSSGQWLQEAYIKASNSEAGDEFGRSVSLYGDRLAVGAISEASNATGIGGDQNDNSANKAGAVYIFNNDNGVWSQQAYIKASNTDSFDLFGWNVVLHEDTLAVSAWGEANTIPGINNSETDNSSPAAGAVYVFNYNDSQWSQQAYIKASNPGQGDRFGYATALFNDRLLVGAYSEDSDGIGINGNQGNNSANASGAAYLFNRVGETWMQEAYIKSSNSDVSDAFGWSVAVSETHLAIGAIGEKSNAVGINGNLNDNSITSAGAAYLFNFDQGFWVQEAYIKASNTDAFDQFGYMMSLDQDYLLVSAKEESSQAIGINGDEQDNSAPESGAAYLYALLPQEWAQVAYIKASNTEEDDRFGWSVAMHQGRLAMGAVWEDSSAAGINGDQSNNALNNPGAVYEFVVKNPFSVNVSGLLTDTTLTLQSHVLDELMVTADGLYDFASALEIGENYEVTVLEQPEGQLCMPINAQGTNTGSDVLIEVVCMPDVYTLGGTLNGLVPGTELILENNWGDVLSLITDGAFVFQIPVINGSEYLVTIQSMPNRPNQLCDMTNSGGTVMGANIDNIQVQCEDVDTIFISGFEN